MENVSWCLTEYLRWPSRGSRLRRTRWPSTCGVWPVARPSNICLRVPSLASPAGQSSTPRPMPSGGSKVSGSIHCIALYIVIKLHFGLGQKPDSFLSEVLLIVCYHVRGVGVLQDQSRQTRGSHRVSSDNFQTSGDDWQRSWGGGAGGRQARPHSPHLPHLPAPRVPQLLPQHAEADPPPGVPSLPPLPSHTQPPPLLQHSLLTEIDVTQMLFII